MKIVVSLFALLIPVMVSAQGDFRPGFIITNTNDSLSGLVKYTPRKNAAISCEFRQGPRQKSESYTPSEIKAYGFFGSKRFVSRTIVEHGKKKQLFLDQLVAGKLSVLRSFHYFYLEGDSLIMLLPKTKKKIETERGKPIKISESYKSQLNHILMECRLSADETDYDESSISAIVQNYNRCKGKEGQRFREKVPASRTDYYFFGGGHGSRLVINGGDKKAFTRNWSPVVGGGLNFSTPRTFDKISFLVEVFYTQKQYTGTVKQQTSSGKVYNDIKIKFPAFQLGFGVRYNVSKEINTPYFKMAYGHYINGNGTMRLITETELDGKVVTEAGKYDYKPSKQGALVVSMGYQRTLYSHSKIFTELRYEKAAGLEDFGSHKGTSTVNNIGILVGLSF